MKRSRTSHKQKTLIKIHKHKTKRDSSNLSDKKIIKSPSLSDFLDTNSKQFFIRKNKNILHDYEQFLKVREERKNGILFASYKKLSYEERKKNETYNLYNKSPFKNDPRLIITNYKILKEENKGNKNVLKNKILGVDEGLIKLPKLNKENNYVELFHGFQSPESTLYDTHNKTNENIIPKTLITSNNNTINGNRHKFILSSFKRKKRVNPMLLERGQEFFSYFGNLEKANNLEKNQFNKNNSTSNEKTSMEYIRNKYIEKMGKQKENYENELNYNYEIKCLDNWDFEHITKKKDIKTDNEFRQFLDEVDNSQMKWLVEIKNDKEQLKIMRRNKHLFDFLTQIDKEQQAIMMQSMNVNKKGFNFEIFEEDESKNKNNKENNNEMEKINKNGNNENDFVVNNSNNNGNVSQVEFYRQVMKDKIKVEEMFHTELRAVAEECYLTNLNKKKAVINIFNLSQELNSLIKKGEKIKETYHKKLKILQNKCKKQDKKKKQSENKNNLLNSNNLNYLSKYKDLKLTLYKKENSNNNNEFKRGNTMQDSSDSSSTSVTKLNSFQQQSEFLAEKNAIEKEYKFKLSENEKHKKELNMEYEKFNKEIKYCHNKHKKAKAKLEQRIKILSSYYYQILKKGIDVRHTGLTWVIVKLLELGAFVDKPHFPTFLNEEQICYLMKIGTKTYELSEFVKLFQILKKKQKNLREKHINDNLEKEKKEQIEKFNKIKEFNKNKKYQIGNDYMEYIEEIQRKYENVINICLNENKEETNIAKISNDLKHYILQDKEGEIEEENYHCNFNKKNKNKKLELLFIPGSLSEYFAKDQRFRQYFDDVFYLNEEINKRKETLNEEKQSYLNKYRAKALRLSLFGTGENNNKYKKMKTSENEIVYAALFGNGISI